MDRSASLVGSKARMMAGVCAQHYFPCLPRTTVRGDGKGEGEDRRALNATASDNGTGRPRCACGREGQHGKGSWYHFWASGQRTEGTARANGRTKKERKMKKSWFAESLPHLRTESEEGVFPTGGGRMRITAFVVGEREVPKRHGKRPPSLSLSCPPSLHPWEARIPCPGRTGTAVVWACAAHCMALVLCNAPKRQTR